MTDERNLAAFFKGGAIEEHAPAGGGPRRAARLAAVFAAGLSAAACAGAPDRTSPVASDAPAVELRLGSSDDKSTLDAFAHAARTAGGGTVTYVDRATAETGQEMRQQLLDNTQGPDKHIANGFPMSAFDSAASHDLREFTSISFKLTNGETYCLGVVDRADDLSPGFLLSADGRSEVPTRVNLNNPDSLGFFVKGHEIAGHCAYPDPTFSKAGNATHEAEVVADSIASALLARREGDTKDVRAISDLRAASVLALSGSDAPVHTVDAPRAVDYYTSPAMDQVASWADKRLAVPEGDPRHLQNMPLGAVVAQAKEIGLAHVLPSDRLTALQDGLDGIADTNGGEVRLRAGQSLEAPGGGALLARVSRGVRATMGADAAPPAMAFGHGSGRGVVLEPEARKGSEEARSAGEVAAKTRPPRRGAGLDM